MEMDESDNISRRTWNRNIATVNKIGFMDGAADGQKSVFQSSFDLGYKQGLHFGFDIGFKKAMSLKSQVIIEENLRDTRKINCQVCLNASSLQQNVPTVLPTNLGIRKVSCLSAQNTILYEKAFTAQTNGKLHECLDPMGELY